MPALRRGSDRDGFRRDGPGRHLRAQDRDLRARLQALDRNGRLPGRGHHLRPQHLRGRHRHRGARQLRGRLHRGHPLDPPEPAARAYLGRGVERELLVPRQRRGARGDPHRLPVSRDPGRDGHGHRQRRPTRRVRQSRSRAEGTRRGRAAEPSCRFDRAAGELCRKRERRRQGTRRGPVLAPTAGERAAEPCAGAGHHAVHRRGHRSRAARIRTSAARYRRPADGRHERGRRPVRRRQDVPAAGGEVGPRDEAGGGAPAALHRGRQAGRRRAERGQDHHGHGQGRRPRHRQEHRRRGAGLQRLRHRRPGRHGAGAEDSRRCKGAQGRHHRPVGPDHAFAGGNGACGEGNAAPGLHHPAA